MGGAAAEKRESSEEGGASASEDLDPASPDKDAGKKKKNKCQMCKKKVGLTGGYSELVVLCKFVSMSDNHIIMSFVS